MQGSSPWAGSKASGPSKWLGQRKSLDASSRIQGGGHLDSALTPRRGHPSPSCDSSHSSASKDKPALVETVEGGIHRAEVAARHYEGAQGEFQFSLELRQGDQYKQGMVQIVGFNWWTKREYRTVLGDGDATRIVHKPLKYAYQLLAKALAGESRTASAALALVTHEGKEGKTLQVTVTVHGEFDEDKHVFKLPDATLAPDAARLQDIVLDLRQESWRVEERARAVEKANDALREENAVLDARVLQLERQVSILLGDHEQHVLSLLNGFRVYDEKAYGPVFAKREGRRCFFNGFVTGQSSRGDHEGTLMCNLPNTLWPKHRMMFNGFFCTQEGYFCNYTVHVKANGQVRVVTYGKPLGIALNLIDYWVDAE